MTAMISVQTLVAVTVACFASTGIANAKDETPMMVKSNAGVALDEHVDLVMCSPDGVAVGGYDLVSYRQDDGPLRGIEDNSATHNGITYLFTSQGNVDLFLQDTDRYLPAYSGFCAITLALGRVTCPDYSNFKIEDDRLLLFEVTGFTNGRTLWNSDATTFRQQADANFERLTELQ